MSDPTDKFDPDDLEQPGKHRPGAHPESALSGDDEDADGWLPATTEARPAPPRSTGKADDLGAVYDIPVQLSAVLGKTTMPVSQLLRLGRGAVVELDRKVGESIDILVNNRLVARGEVVILDDRLGVTMTEIIKTET
jgi:flagellar motor switch protein FliN/FliY